MMLPHSLRGTVCMGVSAAVAAVLLAEVGLFLFAAVSCPWPTPPSPPTVSHRGLSPQTPTAPLRERVLLLSDIHLLGRRRSPLDRGWTDWQLYKSFRMLRWWLDPTAVFLMGDLLDEGGRSTDKLHESYLARFTGIFGEVTPASELGGRRADGDAASSGAGEDPASPSSPASASSTAASPVAVVALIGNHDSEFGNYQRRHMVDRFEAAFGGGRRVNDRLVLPRTNTSVATINSLALDGTPRDPSLQEDLLRFLDAQRAAGRGADILLTHVPLHRPTDLACGAERLREGGHVTYASPERRYVGDGTDVVSRLRSDQVLRSMVPRLVLSGHTHARCHHIVHPHVGAALHEASTVGSAKAAKAAANAAAAAAAAAANAVGGHVEAGTVLPSELGRSHSEEEHAGALEYTIPTFSWRMRPDPGFGVATWGPAGSFPKVQTCELPNEHTVFGIYIALGCVVALLLAHYVVRRVASAFSGKGRKTR